MNIDPELSRRLGQRLLRLYRQAAAMQQPAVADHILCALEALSQSNPACAALRDRTYLTSVRNRLPCARVGATSLRPQIDPSCRSARGCAGRAAD